MRVEFFTLQANKLRDGVNFSTWVYFHIYFQRFTNNDTHWSSFLYCCVRDGGTGATDLAAAKPIIHSKTNYRNKDQHKPHELLFFITCLCLYLNSIYHFMSQPVFLGCRIFIIIFTSYLSFHSAILNNTTCIVSHDMLPMAPCLSQLQNRLCAYEH